MYKLINTLFRLLHWFMMLGAPLVFVLRSFGLELSGVVSGYLCLFFGVFLSSCFIAGILTLIW